jgi:hypothetical protein
MRSMREQLILAFIARHKGYNHYSSVSHGVQIERWKLQQVCSVRDVISLELRTNDPDGKIPKLFDYLSDQKIERLRTPGELTPSPAVSLQEVMAAVYKTWQQGTDEKIASAVRTLKKQLKARLDEFAGSNRGRRLPVSIHIAQKTWDLDIVDQSPAMKRFWEPYFQDHCTTVHIVYGESVFFRSRSNWRSFVRHMDVNDESAVEKIKSLCGLPPDSDLQGGRQFVSAGECAAAIELTQHFERNGVTTNVIRSDNLRGWSPKNGDGLILLGNGRVSSWIADLLKSEGFDHQIEATRLKVKSLRRNPDDDFSVPVIRGIVARTFSADLNCWLTIITANHGRFCEATVRWLLSEKGLNELSEEKKWNSSEPLPTKFEFSGDVDLTEFEEVRKHTGRPVDFKIKH